MKASIFALSAFSLIQLVASQPHGHQQFHRRGVVVTDYATVTSPEVIVWVYEDGQTASIETRTPRNPAATPAPQKIVPELSAGPTPTLQSAVSDSAVPSEATPPSPVQPSAESSPTGESAPSPPTTEAPPEPTNTEAPAPSSEATPAPAPSPEAESPPAPEPAPSTEAAPAPAPAQSSEAAPPPTEPSSTGLGICYSPYNADGTCKTQDQVNEDFNSLTSYSTVRIYGVDCNQISTVISAASSKNIKIFAGLLTIADVAGDLGNMINQLNGNFDGTITTISIGNELVDMGKASPGDVVAALGTARDILGKAGYTGSIVTVDTFNALIAHPELCAASDYCAANAHSYFDPTIEAAGAGEWVQKQIDRIAEAAGGNKKVVITESGWPHSGNSNGAAVPSPENQAKAVESIRGAFEKDVFLFSAFDDKWKADGAWGVEKNWGIM
ncbi:hypothetical protein EPUS_05038 [Endocarpon pusillum Z07020]|uniref:Uncharacterized protein n=1 Tax=Endocarpon pusillum (strain Z07020 / HMAS-L-300199) TaxID=1263415 RepID=U1G6F8_ENDPU|nr:uncharacterized protein EPUS_05038 [Endocarpon pusillum Z07020]ERF72957.1 hypothetical protein EPUS_05038 [Endocarpon pusillum Z07020]